MLHVRSSRCQEVRCVVSGLHYYYEQFCLVVIRKQESQLEIFYFSGTLDCLADSSTSPAAARNNVSGFVSHFISILQSRILYLELEQSGPREGVRCKMLVFYVKSPLAVMAVIPRLGDTDNLHNISCADSLGIVMMVIKITSFHSWPFFSK